MIAPESLQPIQNQATAKAFQLEYDDMLARDIPSALFDDFLESAREAADGSILAASVSAHVQFELEAKPDNPTPKIKRAIRNATYAAHEVVELDSFLRDETNAHEPVIYAIQHRTYPGDVPEFLHLHFTVADGTRVEVLSRDYKGDSYHIISPNVKYGVNSPVVSNGRSLTGLQGTRNYQPNAEVQEGFMMGLAITYPDISSHTWWPKGYRIPVFTAGTQNLRQLYARILESDYRDGYTEHRTSRAGHLLLREAHFMGHAVARDMFDMADQAGILPVWQRQAADDYALEAMRDLQKIEQQGRRIDDKYIDYRRLANFLSREDEGELKLLGFSKAMVWERAYEHAVQLKLQAGRAVIEQMVDLVLGDA